MKLWEVLKALDENPKKRFKSVNYNQEEIIISMGADCYDLPFRVIDSDRDWQEVKQPVTWQEAIQAWADGDTVKCVLGKSESVFFGEKIAFRNQDASVIDKVQIREGTWYIED